MTTLKTQDGKLIVISGASRSGKTVKAMRLIRGFSTVFVWDIEGQFAAQKSFVKVNSIQQLKQIVKSGRKGHYAFVANGTLKELFEQFCACVFYYGDVHGECAVVAEELADVTTTAKAGVQWGILLRRGLKRNITILAISQRWAEADKTALGNASDFYLFRMANMSDIEYMAKKTQGTRVLSEWINRLANLKPLEYLHLDAITNVVKGSKITF